MSHNNLIMPFAASLKKRPPRQPEKLFETLVRLLIELGSSPSFKEKNPHPTVGGSTDSSLDNIPLP